MFTRKILGMLAIMVLVLALPSAVSAQRLPPHVLVGTAWLDGDPAADGVSVSAWVDGAEATSAKVTGGNGSYTLVVDQGDLSFAGKAISFQVDGNKVIQTVIWTQGGGDELTLRAVSGPVGKPGRTVTVDLLELNGSGQSGIASLTEYGLTTHIVLSLSSGDRESELVHIHTGQCGDTLGGVDNPLTSLVGGSGESATTLDVSLDNLQDGDHAINLHDASDYTACGNIPLSTVTIATAWVGLNQYLVDDKGFTVYLFHNDVPGNNSSACSRESCVVAWPPVLTGESPEASGIAGESLLGSFQRADGLGRQLAYNGWPLYYFSQDSASGDTRGQGQANLWWVISVSGEAITNVGPAGPSGDPGLSGATGAPGDKGDAGATGPTGNEGPSGIAGAKGDQGETGPAGLVGEQGPVGPLGPLGAAGDRGPRGDNSSSLAVAALILGIVALFSAGVAFLWGRRA